MEKRTKHRQKRIEKRMQRFTNFTIIAAIIITTTTFVLSFGKSENAETPNRTALTVELGAKILETETETETVNSGIEFEIVKESLPLPSVDGSKKTFMYFLKITREGSEQLKLQAKAWTDSEGFRRIGKYYLVAMATFYAKQIGDTFQVEFADGTIIDVMIGDVKWDDHTDSKNQYHLSDGSIIEFIIDITMFPQDVLENGDMSLYRGQGAVVGIYTGKVTKKAIKKIGELK